MAVIGKVDVMAENQRKLAHILNNVITVLVSVICVINIVLSVIDVSTPIAHATKNINGDGESAT